MSCLYIYFIIIQNFLFQYKKLNVFQIIEYLINNQFTLQLIQPNLSNQINMFSFEASIEDKSKFLKISSLACLKGNQSVYLCMNQDCDKTAFVCSNPKCRCRSQHRKCYFAVTNSIVEKVKSKIISTSDLEIKLSAYIQKTIDQLTSFSQYYIRTIKEKFKYVGLSPLQEEFISNVENYNTARITGKRVSTICSNLRVNQQNLQIFQKSKNHIFIQFQGFFQNLKLLQSQIVQNLHFLSQSRNYKLPSSKNIQSASTIPSKLSNFQSQLIIVDNRSQNKLKQPTKLFEFSNIVKSQSQTDKMLDFFSKKKIKSSKLLYRASQNGFSSKRFHIECDQVQNTLVLCETVQGKIIGGYTPLLWQIVKGQMSQQRDNSLNTFIFSLSQNIKFTSIKLKQNSQVFNNMTSGTSITKSSSEYGPCFGKYEFVIKDEANLQGQNAWVRYEPNSPSFNYGQFYTDSRQFYKKMVGKQQNGLFRVKQWQVWQIKFKNQSSNIRIEF